MKSTQQHVFSEVPKATIPRSTFNRSHGVKTTFNAGYLIPFFVDEALPGDTFNLKTSGFARLATPIYPIMDNMFMDTFYFAVPYRLVWDNFEKFMGEQANPGDSTDYLIPYTAAPNDTGYLEDSLFDYFGIPTKVPSLQHNSLFMRAYNLIFNEWFRDENLQDSLQVPKDDGPDDATWFTLQKRGKRHDYFTSSLPFPQKGPGVEIPIGQSAPVISDPNGVGYPTFDLGGVTTNLISESGVSPQNAFWGAPAGNPGFEASWADPGLTADLSSATAANINQLRQAFQIQKMYERDARGGTRYTELVRSHFGVTSPDSRLQRPEYLGGGSAPVNISPIAGTADIAAVGGAAGSELGRLAAIGTTSFNNKGFSKSFTEHTIVIGLVSVRADLTYQQGLNRMWSRQTRFDHYWPSFAHLGEQEVLNKEIYAQGTADDDNVFGYQERYGEYRYKPSTIHGRFRSNCDAPLDAWHLAQDFSSLPTLSSTFIQENPPVDRVIAVNTEPHFIADFYHKLITARPMPLYGVPGNIDRF